MLKYVGGGFLRGVPARDLKDEEVARYGFVYLVRSGLYVPMKQEQIKEPDKTEQKPARKRKSRIAETAEE